MKQLLHNHKTIVDMHDMDSRKLKWSVWNDRITVDTEKVVLFNTLSRNAVLMNPSEMLRDVADYDDNSLDFLLRNGFLVDSEKDEKRDWEIVFLKAKEDMSYIDLTIVLTNDCQMQYIFHC